MLQEPNCLQMHIWCFSFSSGLLIIAQFYCQGSSLAAGGLPSQKFYPLISAADAKLAKANATAA